MSFFDLTALSLTEIVGDFGFQVFADSGSNIGLFQGIAGYLGVMFFLVRCLSGANIMWINGMWDGMSGLLESLAAYFILGQRLSSPLQYLGMGFIVVGLIFLKTFGTDGKN